MRNVRSIAVAVAISFSASLAPVVAFADAAADAAEAKTHYTRGIELYKEGDYRAALIEFKRANELSPNWRVQFNLGQASLELADYASALTAFKRYLTEGGAEVPADRKKSVDAEVAKLETRVARVDLTVNVDGADVTVDDAPAGKTPLKDPLLVSAGRRKISVSKGSMPAVVKVIDLAGGDRQKLALDLAEPGATTAPTTALPLPPPTATTTASAPPPPPPVEPPSRVPMWIGVGVTGLLVAGTVVAGTTALSAKSNLDKQLNVFPVNAGTLANDRSKVKTRATITDVFGGAAIVAAAITVYLGLRPSDPAPTTTGAAPRVNVDVGLGSVSLAGSF